MGWLDKLLGRGKKAAGDVMGDSSMRREGMHQEQAGMAEDRAEAHEDASGDGPQRDDDDARHFGRGHRVTPSVATPREARVAR